ncbi:MULTISPECIES: hypothetical protein [unclassified Shimia]|uniref:hypothetical protein n=1 Tax=unclassified Shimia TaxID=2630038 RepID=UPI00334299BC
MPWLVRLLFLAAVVLIAMSASGVLNPKTLPAAPIAVAVLALTAVIWGVLALMRSRR